MDEGLFAKHISRYHTHKATKHSLAALIEEKTGVLLEEGEYEVSGKQVTLQTSSVKKNTLIRKGIEGILTEAGYRLTF